MFKVGQVVKWYRPGCEQPLERVVSEVVDIPPVLDQYVERAAVLKFTTGDWAFSWNVWP